MIALVDVTNDNKSLILDSKRYLDNHIVVSCQRQTGSTYVPEAETHTKSKFDVTGCSKQKSVCGSMTS